MTTMEDLKSYIKYFTRLNQYDYILTLPSIGLPNTVDMNKKLRVFGRSTSVPSVTMENHVTKIFNERRGVPMNIDFDNITITFFDTHNLFFHKMFYSWVTTSKFDMKGRLRFYPSQFSGSINIKVNDKEAYRIEGIYPLTVGDFRLDDSAVDQFGTFDVTFFVKKVVPINPNDFDTVSR